MNSGSLTTPSARTPDRPAGFMIGVASQADRSHRWSQATDPGADALATQVRRHGPLRELFKAIAMDSLDAARRAIAQGADPNGAAGAERRFPLAAAVLADRPAMVRLLLRAGADPSQQDAAGSTPLMMAAAIGSIDSARALLARGALVDACDGRGVTALMEAARNRHDKLVALLIRHGARPDLQDRNGETALMLAAAAGDYASLQHLASAGADPDLQDRNGESALDRACRQNRHAALATLVCFGCRNGPGAATLRPLARPAPEPADTTTKDGQTALMLAAKNGDLLIMDLLIRSGVQIDKQDARGETALMKAAYYGQTMAVDMLLARGADASIRSNSGDSALELANQGARSVRHAQVMLSLKAVAEAAKPNR